MTKNKKGVACWVWVLILILLVVIGFVICFCLLKKDDGISTIVNAGGSIPSPPPLPS